MKRGHRRLAGGSACPTLLAVVAMGLHAQGIRMPREFPPDIAAASVTVTGLSGAMVTSAVTLTAADLGMLPQHTVKTTDHGAPVTFEGVLLTDVLAKVGQPLGEKFHNTGASYYLVAEGNDGYRATFAWAEMDSTFMDKSVYVVTRRDGKLLSDKDGPFELVAPGEKRNARWVRQLKALTIKRAD